MFRFYIPGKHQQSGGFQMFSWGIEVEHGLKWVSEFMSIDYLISPLKSSENQRFSDDFRGNRS